MFNLFSKNSLKSAENMIPVKKAKECTGTVLGQLDKECTQCLDWNHANSNALLIIGDSGTGKSFCVIKPNIELSAKNQRSLVIADNYDREDIAILQKYGYDIRELDLDDLPHSAGWNILKSLSGDRMEEKVAVFARTVIASGQNGAGVLTIGSVELLSAVILKVLLDPNMEEGDRTIAAVYQILSDPNSPSSLYQLFDEEHITEAEQLAREKFEPFLLISPNMAGAIAENVHESLAVFQDSNISKKFSHDGISFERNDEKPVAFFLKYCNFPKNTRVLAVSFIALLMDRAFHSEFDLDFFLIDLPYAGMIDNLNDFIEAESPNRLFMSVKTITDFASYFQHNAKDVMSKIGCVVLTGSRDQKTRQWFSGQYKEVVDAKVKKDLSLTEDDIGSLDFSKVLVVVNGKQPLLANKLPYLDFAAALKK